jgi:hypothetical protein
MVREIEVRLAVQFANATPRGKLDAQSFVSRPQPLSVRSPSAVHGHKPKLDARMVRRVLRDDQDQMETLL